MSVSKRKFNREFKVQVVNEVESGLKSRAQATREHELLEGIVAKWILEYRKDPQGAFTKTSSSRGFSPESRFKSRIMELEWALGRKTMENEILKRTLEGLNVKRGIYTHTQLSKS